MLQLRKIYYQNFWNFVLFYFILRYSHFFLQDLLKIMTPTRWILTTLRKTHENICEQSSHKFLNAIKFSQHLSWQHAMLHKILQFWAIFEPRYLLNTSYKLTDFLDFTQIIQNESTSKWKYDEAVFTTVQSIRTVSLKCAIHLVVNQE